MTSPWRPAITFPSPTLLSHSPDKPTDNTHTSLCIPATKNESDTPHNLDSPSKTQNACHFCPYPASPHGSRPSRGRCHTATGESNRFRNPVSVMEVLMSFAPGIGAPAGHEPSRRLCRGMQLLLLWRGVHLLLSRLGTCRYDSAPSIHRQQTFEFQPQRPS